MGELMKTEKILEDNLCNLFAVLMSLCDSDNKNQVESMNEFSDLKARLNTIEHLGLIKKLVYTRGTNEQ